MITLIIAHALLSTTSWAAYFACWWKCNTLLGGFKASRATPIDDVIPDTIQKNGKATHANKQN